MENALVSFEVIEQRGLAALLTTSLKALWYRGQAGEWSLLAKTSDGAKFIVAEYITEGDATNLERVCTSELAAADSPEQWARSRGFDALAMHLQRML